MKYWQKTYLGTLLVFLAALNISAFFTFDTAFRTALASERKRAFSEQAFIGASLEKDLDALKERGAEGNRAALNSLYQTYARYYYTQGILLALKTPAGDEFSNAPGLSPAFAILPPGADACSTADAGGTSYLYISGRIGSDGYSLVTARSMQSFRESMDALSVTLLVASVCISALLSVVLLFLLRKLASPIQRLSAAAAAFSQGNHDIRTRIGGKDELADLSRHFNEMSDKIQSQIAELTAESEMKQRFIDDLAHEMRTPLTAIGGYAQYLLSAAIHKKERISALSYIYRESVRLEELSEKLMLLTRLKIESTAEERVYLPDLFEDLQLATASLAADKGVALDFKIAEASWQSDGGLLYILFLNLIQNALRACSRDGTIKISAVETLVEVRDDGCGMDGRSLAHVTEPFYRADKSRSRSEGGVGLGLSICKAICERLGLILRIESEMGKGTRVQVLQDVNKSTTDP